MDKKERKCIAVVISKPERKYQEGLLRGICNTAFAKGMNVAVFATSLLEGMEEYLWGEEEIYELIQYDKFAGVVCAIGSFYGGEITDKISKKMQEVAASGIPVVVVDGRVEGLPSYFNDDSNAVADLIDHLVKEHANRDIAFMTGRKGHPHAENALQSFRNCMTKNGIKVFEERIYYGDYWYNEGENFVKQLEESSLGLPQAIICANEFMAISVYKALYARGVYMPKHIKLACTTNDSSTAPYFLVGENNLENVGREACEKILRVIDGEELGDEEKFFECKNNLITSVGCGCQKASAYDYSKERGILLDTDAGYFGELNFARENMIFVRDYASFAEALERNIEHVRGYKEMHLCMCEGWDDPNRIIMDIKKNPYSDRMQIFYSRIETESGTKVTVEGKESFEKVDMFPGLFEDTGEPTIYVFHSLHYLDRNYGYVVLNNGQSTHVYDYLFNFWLHDVADGIESLCRLKSVNYMYYTDIMTGLYNRNGYNTLLFDVVTEAKKKGKSILYALADMNFLKKINDTYGHEEGDVAIKAAASIIKDTVFSDALEEKNFRIGGDEFVKIAVGDFTEESIKQFKDRLYEAADIYTKNSGKPYITQLSLGCYIGKADSVEDIDSFLSKADEAMYQEKVRLKATRQ